MSHEPDESQGAGVEPSRSRPPRSLDATLSISRETIKALMQEIRQEVREAMREELVAQRPKPPTEAQSASTAVPPPSTTSRGLELQTGESLKARDLRTALLLGKVPENAGLLIDAGTFSQLMSISQRTLYRLIDEKAVPEPLRISGRLLRWRLGELLEWIEAGCPHTKYWSYSPEKARSGKKVK